jgi:hypothetical protein
MFRLQAPVLIVATAEASDTLGARLRDAALVAWREIALAAKGLEIAHLQFLFGKTTLAVCSRVRRDGLVEIEIGLGDPALPASVITAEQMRQAHAARPWRASRQPRARNGSAAA